jgi:hypothetical protein
MARPAADRRPVLAEQGANDGVFERNDEARLEIAIGGG